MPAYRWFAGECKYIRQAYLLMFNIGLYLHEITCSPHSIYLNSASYMKYLLAVLIFSFSSSAVFSQATLPAITVTNLNGRIVVSWMNDYKEAIATISIQRYYDSLKNYTTIGSVLNPQNLENGYTDPTPPYNKMYYRVLVVFEGGKYVITPPVRPVKLIVAATTTDSLQIRPDVTPGNTDSVNIKQPADNVPAKPLITYPSQRIFTARDQSVVINLPGASSKQYVVKFYDEQNKEIFQLTKLTEDYLIVEKVNFIHSGWFHFELFDNGELVEKNRFFIPKDVKKNGDDRRRK